MLGRACGSHLQRAAAARDGRAHPDDATPPFSLGSALILAGCIRESKTTTATQQIKQDTIRGFGGVTLSPQVACSPSGALPIVCRTESKKAEGSPAPHSSYRRIGEVSAAVERENPSEVLW